ncbi:hypothetical protein N7532_008300 [Penicillium argentinense]|uniref:Zn(2)-C6 fungal-type domain-containing protein n=1 Tax=Penicillium argentinense TaxID=1131581 RepID=A0A9W9EXB5_9EURO|nr:uncharacterized protein N7532_008300 [Penicillium argentinense]KAJ5089616.1 hypothetical protein N7532_008300 [Penicillium argentinense]
MRSQNPESGPWATTNDDGQLAGYFYTWDLNAPATDVGIAFVLRERGFPRADSRSSPNTTHSYNFFNNLPNIGGFPFLLYRYPPIPQTARSMSSINPEDLDLARQYHNPGREFMGENFRFVVVDPTHPNQRAYWERSARTDFERGQQRDEMKILRQSGGACIPCYQGKKKCDPGNPCRQCLRRGLQCVRKMKFSTSSNNTPSDDVHSSSPDQDRRDDFSAITPPIENVLPQDNPGASGLPGNLPSKNNVHSTSSQMPNTYGNAIDNIFLTPADIARIVDFDVDDPNYHSSMAAALRDVLDRRA